MVGVFTIDVEDWYHPLGRDQKEWSDFESRAHIGTEQLLDVLDAHAAKATFFVLGAVAERQPWIVEAIAERGHEIGTHGHNHERLDRMHPLSFRDDLHRSIDTLVALGAGEVTSYRAPYFSLGPKTRWAIPVLAELAITIDSSLFPMRTGRYGISRRLLDALTRELADSGIRELAIGLPTLGALTLPLTGGFYCRFFPSWLTTAAQSRVASKGVTPVFYVHPWELDPEQPRLELPRLLAFRHYMRLGKTATVVDRVLGTRPWTSARSLVQTSTAEGADVRRGSF